MKRRDFFAIAGAAAITGLNLASCTNDSTAESTSTTAAQPSELDTHTGAVTLYYEFRIAGPENTAMLAAVDALSLDLANKTGFLSLSLKNTVGDSTMVKNYPAALKGVLGTAYKDGFAAGRMPLFYALFIRFETLAKLKASGVESWFDTTVAPMLHLYQPGAAGAPPTKLGVAFDYYEGYFKTVAAGNRTAIYKTEAEILAFLKAQEDTPDKGYITVENHVAIHADKTDEFNQKVIVLLTTAQQTYRPDVNDTDFDGALDTTLIGQPGAADNTYYRRAVTTEILQNLQVEKNAARSYLMHGVWQSVFDHENSHLDVRFIQSSTPTGVYVVAGPVEPFYETRRLRNTA